MPNGNLYDYVPDANNDLNATLAASPLAAVAPSIWYNPSLLTSNTGLRCHFGNQSALRFED